MRATPPAAATSGFITTAEVCERFFGGTSPQTVLGTYVRHQGLPACKVGRRWFFNPAEVENWIRARGGVIPAAAAPDDDELDARVRALVDQFPPLTDEQVDKIALMLRGGACTRAAMSGAA